LRQTLASRGIAEAQPTVAAPATKYAAFPPNVSTADESLCCRAGRGSPRPIVRSPPSIGPRKGTFVALSSLRRELYYAGLAYQLLE